MNNPYEKDLEKSINELKNAEHISFVTYPLLRDKKILLTGFEKIYNSLIALINSMIKYEYMFKRVGIYQDPKENLRTFSEEIAPRYGVSEKDLNNLKEIIYLFKEHKKSSIEFLRKEKIIIMSQNLNTNYINLEKIKDQIRLIKELHKKFYLQINRN